MTSKTARIEAVDAARGVALAAMAVYHFVWDLSFYRFVRAETFYDPRFQMFGHAIAVSFLALVGVSLALAARDTLNVAGYLRRTALVAGAAALVSAGTYWFMPDAFIAFGILHCIAAASLLTLAFARARWFVAAGAGALIVLAPLALASPALDGSNWFLGLGAKEPRTLDWRPLFPWTGFALIGFGLARLAIGRGLPGRLADWRARGAVSRALSFGGRHSLAVYLLHQPVLIAIVFLAATASANLGAVGPSDVQETDFRLTCAQECEGAGVARATCVAACDCVVREAKNEGLWTNVVRDALSAPQRSRFDAITRACLRTGEPLAR